MSNKVVSAPIMKTALDAIQAKYSAIAAGYCPMVIDNQEIYQELLQTVAKNSHRSGRNLKCQTPLVNAGYATRVLAMSSRIRSFLSYHSVITTTTTTESSNLTSRSHVQILFLGCGFDVIGFWAAKSTSLDITIIEVDISEVCEKKRELLSSQPGIVIQLKQSVSSCERLTYYHGEIAVDNKVKRSVSHSKQPYILIPIDLKDTNALDVGLNDPSIPFHSETPTLIISELVLAYLPPSNTDHLLSWCAKAFGNMATSALVAIEPLGYDENNARSDVIGVEEGYRRDYCKKFEDSMKKGQADLHSRISMPSLFHPIGTSLVEIQQRFLVAGFGQASATTLAIAATLAAASTIEMSLNCPEPFDEHAGLVLHLKSYAMICGFVAASQQDELFRRMMSPWEFPNAIPYARAALPKIDVQSKIVYTEIEWKDESTVRNLFQSTYQEYTNEYPSIRKLVKGVLNKEMKESSRQSLPSKRTELSSIAEYYRSRNGIFLVAVKYDADSDTNASDLSRRVVGFVGVHICESKHVESGTMEVFRLSVDPQYRGRGIAKELLNSIEAYAFQQASPMLIINTLSLLEGASNLYISCGFCEEREALLGQNLIMKTFAKVPGCNDRTKKAQDLYKKNMVEAAQVARQLEEEQVHDSYLDYEVAAPTNGSSIQSRQRRRSLLGHIMAWAGAVNQEHLDLSRTRERRTAAHDHNDDDDDMKSRGSSHTIKLRSHPSNRRGSLDSTMHAVHQNLERREIFLSNDELDQQYSCYNDDVIVPRQRRNSLNAMVEQAVAYANLRLDPNDEDLDPFGSRRDSLF